MKLSVVIPTYDRRDALERTLPTVIAQEFPAAEYEVVIVVDGSTDGTIQMLRELKPRCTLRFLEQPHRGPAASRNVGIDAARGELVLFLDDDMICSADLLSRHVAAHTGPDPVVAHGKISVAPGSPATLVRFGTEPWYKAYFSRLDRNAGLQFPQDGYLVSNSSVPRVTLLACGGFDEQIPSEEDYELGLRLWKMGVRFRYVPEAAACEFFVKSSVDYLRTNGKAAGKAEVYLCRKHPEYRPLSTLAGFGKMGWGMQGLWQTALRLPVSPAYLLRAPIWAAERQCRLPPIRRAGVRLLGVARHIEEGREALREAGSWKAFRQEFAMRLPVLLYHHVGPRRPGTSAALTVSPERFERQVRWLARHGYAGILPSDWNRWLRDGKGLPDRPVLLTFDDGYADLADYALPVLRRYGFGAVVFVVTAQVGKTNAWDEANGLGTHQLMTADQIRNWAAQRIEFGAHSRTHPDLTTLADNELEAEVAGSKLELEDILGSRVISFAYPYGPYNQKVCDSVRGVFDLAFTTDEGLNDLRTDPHILHRTMVWPDFSIAGLDCSLRLGRHPVRYLRQRVRLRSRLKRAVAAVLGTK